MLTSLFTAVSGMNANGMALSVIGDNVANMNTTAFKSSRASFADILSQSSGSDQVGRGVLVNGVTPNFTQGSFENTSNVLDLAVDGEGMFMVNDSSGTFYTRAGQFNLDKNGYVVNPGGLRLQGYLFSNSGTATSGLGDINLSTLNSAPDDTSNISISANLDSRVPVIAGGLDIADVNGTSNFSSSITVYDSLGNDHVLNIYFTKTSELAAGNTWEWNAVVNGSDSASGSSEIQAHGTLSFNNNGALASEGTQIYDLTSGGFDFNGGAATGQKMAFDFGTSIAESGAGLDGATQYGADSATLFQSQDGFSSGSLRNITIAQDGIITGIFTNGQTRGVGQVAIAKFLASTELTKMGKNLYAESTDSGQPVIGTPGASGAGQVLANTLELSNVDLAEEFVKLMLSQRGFQANSRIISTSDELMVELVNLKR